MTHSFYIEDAVKYGMPEAVILRNLKHWIEKNEANGKNLHDGRYWTYNTSAAFTKLFPYLTKNQVDRILKKLVDKEVILKGNYNQHKYDRTCWYALCDLIYEKTEKEIGSSINADMHNHKPIPDINAVVNTDIKPPCKEEEESKTKINYELVRENWNNFVKNNSLPKILSMNSARRTKIKTRMSEESFDFQKVLDEIAISDLLLGKVSGWSVKFDWIFENDSNYVKILEGNYRNNGAVAQADKKDFSEVQIKDERTDKMPINDGMKLVRANLNNKEEEEK